MERRDVVPPAIQRQNHKALKRNRDENEFDPDGVESVHGSAEYGRTEKAVARILTKGTSKAWARRVPCRADSNRLDVQAVEQLPIGRTAVEAGMLQSRTHLQRRWATPRVP